MRRVLGAVAVLGMLALSGCGGGTPLPTLPPTPSSTPVFASEEEALAAAEEAYAAYSEASSLIASDGGADPHRVAPYVTEEQLRNELATADYYASNGVHSVGSPVITFFQLQDWSQAGTQAEIVVYVCVDVSMVRVVDSDGVDVTPPDREPVVPLEVLITGDAPDALLVASSEQWSGSSFC